MRRQRALGPQIALETGQRRRQSGAAAGLRRPRGGPRRRSRRRRASRRRRLTGIRHVASVHLGPADERETGRYLPQSGVISYSDTPIELKFDMTESMRQGDHAFTHEGSGVAPEPPNALAPAPREGSRMGQKTVRFSDLSGQLIMHDDALARIVVHEHPELGDGPVEIEALTDEAEAIEEAALRVAVVDLYLRDDLEPRRLVLEADVFDKLATENPMSELLIAARPARRSSRAPANGTARGDRLDYATLEHAGQAAQGQDDRHREAAGPRSPRRDQRAAGPAGVPDDQPHRSGSHRALRPGSAGQGAHHGARVRPR